jgi:hypothetical protein
MSTQLPLRVRRFIVIAFCATFAVFGLFLFVIPFADSDTTFTSVCFYTVMAVSWPILVAGAVCGEGPPVSVAIFLFGCIATGMFWAFIVELIFMIKKRLWANKSLDKIISK